MREAIGHSRNRIAPRPPALPSNHREACPNPAALTARMAPSGQRIGPVEGPARGQDRGKEQSDETATPLDEIGAGGKRETGGHPPLAARRPPNRPPPPEGPARARPARPRLTFLPPRPGVPAPHRCPAWGRRATGGPVAPRTGPPPFLPHHPPVAIRTPPGPPIPCAGLTPASCRLRLNKPRRAPGDCPRAAPNHPCPLTDRLRARRLCA